LQTFRTFLNNNIIIIADFQKFETSLSPVFNHFIKHCDCESPQKIWPSTFNGYLRKWPALPGENFFEFWKKNIFENKNVFPFGPFIWEAIADIKISIHTDIYMGEEFCTIDYFGFHQQQKQTNHCVQTVMCWYAEHFLVKFLGPGKFWLSFLSFQHFHALG